MKDIEPFDERKEKLMVLYKKIAATVLFTVNYPKWEISFSINGTFALSSRIKSRIKA